MCFLQAARSLDVDCIVAPYEADAQLAYLAKKGIVQAVITEDSDLVAFGCPRVRYIIAFQLRILLEQRSSFYLLTFYQDNKR